MSKKLIEEATKHCRDSEDFYYGSRKEFIENLRFVELGEQWFEDDKRKRLKNQRLMVVVNLLHKFVKHFTGILQQERLSVKIKGVENDDLSLAVGLDMLIDNIFNHSKARDAINMAIYHAVAGGYGFGRIVNVYESDTSFYQELRIEKILNPLTVYPCPYSTDMHMADQKKCVIITEVPRDIFEKEHGKIEEADFPSGAFLWATPKVVRIAEYFYTEPKDVELYLLANGQTVELTEGKDAHGNTVLKTGGNTVISINGVATLPELSIEKQKTVKRDRVMWCKLTGDRVLSKPREMPCSVIPVFCLAGSQVWIDGRRYMRPLIQDGKDPAKMFNFIWTTILEVVKNQPLAPFLLEKAQISGLEEDWKIAQEQLLAYLPFNPREDGTSVQPTRQRPPEVSASLLTVLQNAHELIYDSVGYFRHQFGEVGDRTSGAALNKRLLLSNSGQYEFLDHLDGFIKTVGKTLLEMIPRTYEVKQVERIVGREVLEEFQKQGNDISQLLTDFSAPLYDVIVDASPAFATKRDESLEWLVRLLQTAPPQVPLTDILVELKDLPVVAKIKERFKLALPELFPDDEMAQAILARRAEAAQAQQYRELLALQREQLSVEGKELANTHRALKVSQAKTNFQDETEARSEAASGMDALNRSLASGNAGG